MNLLIIDDDVDVRTGYERMLGGLGHLVRYAANRTQAEAALRERAFDVVWLDQNLEGADGGPVGLDLIDAVRTWSPSAAILIVSGYWQEPATVQAAFERGADDYLAKGEHLPTLLLAKLRHLDAGLAERRRCTLRGAQLEQSIVDGWRALQTADNSQAKGRLLEDLVVALLRSAGGFREVTARRGNGAEEFDVVALAQDNDWYRQSALWLFECKNWSSPAGRDEFDVLAAKMGRRHARCSLGVFVAWAGVTGPFARAAGRDGSVVAVVTRADLQVMVQARERATVLQGWVDRAVLCEA